MKTYCCSCGFERTNDHKCFCKSCANRLPKTNWDYFNPELTPDFIDWFWGSSRPHKNL